MYNSSFRTTVYDREYERCVAMIDSLFEKKPGLEPNVVRVGLKSPDVFLNQHALPIATRCIENLLVEPVHAVDEYVDSLISCIRQRGLPISRGATPLALKEEVVKTVVACMESYFTQDVSLRLTRDRRSLYMKAMYNCLLPVVNCMHKVANAFGFGATAGELRV